MITIIVADSSHKVDSETIFWFVFCDFLRPESPFLCSLWKSFFRESFKPCFSPFLKVLLSLNSVPNFLSESAFPHIVTTTAEKLGGLKGCFICEFFTIIDLDEPQQRGSSSAFFQNSFPPHITQVVVIIIVLIAWNEDFCVRRNPWKGDIACFCLFFQFSSPLLHAQTTEQSGKKLEHVPNKFLWCFQWMVIQYNQSRNGGAVKRLLSNFRVFRFYFKKDADCSKNSLFKRPFRLFLIKITRRIQISWSWRTKLMIWVTVWL